MHIDFYKLEGYTIFERVVIFMTHTKSAHIFPLQATLQKLRHKKKLTQKQVAEKLGVSPVTVSGWEIGKRMPEPQMLPRIAQVFGTTVDNLLGYSATADSFRIGDVVYVPIYESVAVNEGRLAFLNFHGTYPVPAEVAAVPRGVQAVLIPAPDSSMAMAGIGEGCLVLTHVNATVRPGDFCMTIIDGARPCIRHYSQVQPDTIVLKAADPAQPSEVYAAGDRKRVCFVGPCVGVFHVLPRGKETD